MIVFDLKCADGHVFEIWFGSSNDYESQKARRLIACPYCADTHVEKAVMAPNVAAKGNSSNQNLPAAQVAPGDDDKMKAMITTLAKAQAQLLSKSKWVGRDFDKTARAMDAGEVDRTTIHGEATPQEAKALIDDGISVLPLPLPVVPPDKRN